MSKRLSAIFLAWLAIAVFAPCAMSDSMSNKPGSGGGGGTPGGSNTQIQYNNAGSFGGLTNTQVATRVGPVTTVVTGDYTVVAGGNQLLQVNSAIDCTLTLPLSTSSAGTQLTILNQGPGVVTLAVTAPDNIGANTIQPGEYSTITPSNDGGIGDVGWFITNYQLNVLNAGGGGTGLASSGADATKGLVSDGATGWVLGTVGLPETPLSVAHGGTGAATLTGALVGNGTSAVTAGTLSVSNGGTGATTLASGQLLKGAGTSAIAALTGTGAVSLSSNTPSVGTLSIANGGTGQTSFASGYVTSSGTVLSTVPTLVGGTTGQIQYNNAGSFGGLTDTQLTTHINAFTTALSGAAPASGGGTTNFLRADGTWAAAGGAVASPVVLQSTANAQIPLTIKGVTNTQTAHLLEWYYQDNSTLTGYVSADGLTLHSFYVDTQSNITGGGDISIAGAFITSGVGKTLNLKSGANGATGTGTLSGGTVTISNTSVTANSKIFCQATGGTCTLPLILGTVTPGTGFVVTGGASDTTTFIYFIINTF